MRKLAIIFLFFSFTPTKPIGELDANLNYEKVAENHIDVKVTTYTVSAAETDSDPTITASGFEVDSLNPKKHRIIAVSRDLKKKFKFGQRVKVTGIGKHSGVYVVRDVMNKRWEKKIDILINPDDKPFSFKSAKIYALNEKND
jgi:3D (Asp-Asp-Asp) domain-containing protein